MTSSVLACACKSCTSQSRSLAWGSRWAYKGLGRYRGSSLENARLVVGLQSNGVSPITPARPGSGVRGREQPLSERWSDESAFRDWIALLVRRRLLVLSAIVVVPVVALVVSHRQQ